MNYIGDFADNAIVPLGGFTTNAGDGGRESFSAGLEEADITIYSDDGDGTWTAMTLDAGSILITENPGSQAGVYLVAVDMSNDSDFTTGKDYVAVLYPDSETVDSQNVSAILGHWSCDNRIARANQIQILGDGQSATDLKDFADDGYDPSTNKVTGVVLVDTTTTNTDMRGTDNAALASALSTAQTDLDTLTGSDGATLATSQPNYAPATATALGTAQADLDTLTGSDGATLATSQPNYAPATATALVTAQSDLDTLTGSDGATLATSQPNYAPATAAALTTHDGKLDTAQTDLDTITGSDGVTLATAQGNYAPAVAGAEMDLVDAPNATAVTAIQNGLATASNLALVKAVTDALTAAAAAKLAVSSGTIITGTVSDAVTSPTTTVFAADDITEATADHYIGRIIIFTSGALTGQATDITDYELDTSEGKFTVTALTESPANNDEFVII